MGWFFAGRIAKKNVETNDYNTLLKEYENDNVLIIK